jgi:hypothetical protein
MATRRDTTRSDGPGPTAAERVAARDAIRASLATIRPLVSQSRDGLTLILLEPRPRALDRRSGGAAPAPRSAGAAESLTTGTEDESERAGATRAFTLPPGTTGMAVGVFDRIVAMDLFDDPRDLAEAWPRLVDAAVGSWIERRRAVTSGAARPPERRQPDAGALGRLVRRSADALDDASVLTAAGPAALRIIIDDPRVSGAALVVDGRPVHVAIRRREEGDAMPAEAP